MIVFCNEKGEIKDVNINSLNDSTLTEYYIDDEDNPLAGFSAAKCCCYKIAVEGGRIIMMTPYVDSRLLDHIDRLGRSTEVNANDIEATMGGLTETFEAVGGNAEDIAICMEAITEIYEMIGE